MIPAHVKGFIGGLLCFCVCFLYISISGSLIFRAIVDIAVYSKQRRIERIVKDDESSIRSDTRV